ncbi:MULTISPECIES: glycosyl hydrolase family 95 catalytic domain-containing protein [unclassified Streptomyces]|uniref:glycosyl hydrolase family 95 catalytic domain-containing protein n=1 Tax=unclassified Streptomyces TaxID=2593676 RepID=UPI002E246D36|nr:Tat pathway signal sequence domain protein [Streptomyces sp. NBC_01023]
MHGGGDVSRRTLMGGALAGAALGTAVAGTAAAQPRQEGAPPPSPEPPAVPAFGDRPWTDILADSDMVWQTMPATWEEGPFLGNGFLGSGIYAEPDANAIRFNVQHSEVQDHRPEFGSIFGLARLPIGYFTLEPVGTVTAVDWRFDLWNSELTGTVTTAAGSLHLRAVVHAERSVLAVEIIPTEGERDHRWTFHPAQAISPRAAFKPLPEGYTANPPATVSTYGTVEAAVQPLLSGGQHVTAWREVERGAARTLYVSVAHSFPTSEATGVALRTVRKAATQPLTELVTGHRTWWHTYYRKSFLSVPDARLQSFYWIQLYKVAAAARKDAPVMATTGPWLEPTPWPASWWNLNVQLEYWLIHGSNHLELDGLTRSLSAFQDNVKAQTAPAYRSDSLVIARSNDTTLNHGLDAGPGGTGGGIPGQDPPTPEVGNLTWALHNVWLSYRHTMDESILRDVVFPLLRKSINYYLHFLEPGSDGKLHLPKTFSPEYGVDTPDTNYDLALIRWGCTTLLDSARILGIDDRLTPRWRDVLLRLTPAPTDTNGFMIGAGQPFAMSHRHYSHMLSVYPLYLVNWEQPENRGLIKTSLDHWISFTGALQGYSYTGAASFAAQMLDGDTAAGYLSDLLRLYVQPNTLYKESGPVIETPLSAAQSLHDMICQSWGGVIRVFPAIPSDWKDVTVHDFRTQGAFLLSAARAGGRTRWVRLYSEAGAPCVLRTDIAGSLEVRDGAGRALHWTDLGNGTLRIDLPRGHEAWIHPRGSRPSVHLAPVTPNAPAPRWGLPT